MNKLQYSIELELQQCHIILQKDEWKGSEGVFTVAGALNGGGSNCTITRVTSSLDDPLC